MRDPSTVGILISGVVSARPSQSQLYLPAANAGSMKASVKTRQAAYLMRAIGIFIAFAGIALSAAFLYGFGGVLTCGTWNLGCLVYATVTALVTQSCAAVVLFSSITATKAGSAARYMVILLASVCSLLAMGCLSAILLVVAR